MNKKRKKKILTILQIFIFQVFITFALGIPLIIFLLHFATLTQIQDNVINSCEENLTYKIEFTANKIANAGNYSLNKYDCSDFSRDLVRNLTKEGISAYCVSGLYNKIIPHTWIEILFNNQTIPIEATSGEIIDNETYTKDYFILTKGYCL